MDIHQSSLYAQFMEKIGWKVEKIDDAYIYIKQLPIIGSLIKIQRPHKLPELNKIKHLAKRYRAHSIIVEPALNSQLTINNQQSNNVTTKQLTNAFLPTKTIHIDLTPSIETILDSFTPAKRKAIRRAQNLGIQVVINEDIESFVKLKSSTAGFLGFLTTTTLKPLWHTFAPIHARILLAQLNNQQSNKYLAGILLLYFDNIAYYWIAAATSEGKRFFAPTLLIWEALKRAKKNKCTVFDFEGVYDERFPKSNSEWLGFNKFKQGFGGKEVYFLQPFKIT